MSHFSVMVIGDNIEKQLEPYQENTTGNCPEEYLEFYDEEDKYREEFENKTRKEFYCSSSSSWGQEISDENYKILESCQIGDVTQLFITEGYKFGYFTLNKKYRCYPSFIDEYPEGLHIWIEVLQIMQTDHPDKDVCFTGKIKVKLIDPPKEISLKEFYTNEFYSKYPKKLISSRNKFENESTENEEIFKFFIKDWAGYEEKDSKTGKYGYWENPNAKWDWYEIGGRYTGYFNIKPALQIGSSIEIEMNKYENEFGFSHSEFSSLVSMYIENRNKFNTIVLKYKGQSNKITDSIENIIKSQNNYENSFIAYRKGLLGTPGVKTKTGEIGTADQLMKGDIDLDLMKKEAGDKAAEEWDTARSILDKCEPLQYYWKDLLEMHDKDPDSYSWKELKEKYWNQEAVKQLNEYTSSNNSILNYNTDPYEFNCSREDYILNKVRSCITPFAVVKDSKWYEKGKMGWWACVSNEKEQDIWNKEFLEIFENLSDDTLITIVDCHI